MKPYFFALMLTTLFSNSVFAEMQLWKCESTDKRTSVTVATSYQGNAMDVVDAGSKPAEATMVINKIAGVALSGKSVKLAGEVNNSAKGLYMDLSTSGASLFISAPASHSPSELKFGEVKFDVECEQP